MSVTRIGAAAAAGLAALLLTGCAGIAAPVPGVPAAGAPTAAAPAADAPTDGALTIDQRTIQDELVGMEASVVTYASSVDEFLGGGEASGPSPLFDEDTRTRFVDAGFVQGVTQVFTGNESYGYSIVMQTGSPEQAIALEEANWAASFLIGRSGPEGTLPGAAASHTAGETSTSFGVEYGSASVTFVEGPFVHIVTANGLADVVEPQAVIDAAAALLARVQGRPAA